MAAKKPIDERAVNQTKVDERSAMETVETSVELSENALFSEAFSVYFHDGEAEANVETETITANSPAESAFQRLAIYMQQFEAGLSDEEEMAIGFAGSTSGVLRIEQIGYFAPDFVNFSGRDKAGNRQSLIQHFSQLSVMLKAVPKTEDTPNRIGFELARALHKDMDATKPKSS